MFIVVVDRNKSTRKLCQIILQTAGHVVKTTGSSVEAFKLCPQADVVISELFPSDYQDLTFLKYFRENFPHIQMIALSDGIDTNEMDFLREVNALGATSLAKPFGQPQLLATIAKCNPSSLSANCG